MASVPVEAGEPANLAVLDPDGRWTVDPGRLASRSTNTPFTDVPLVGRTRHTFLHGVAVVRDGAATR